MNDRHWRRQLCGYCTTGDNPPVVVLDGLASLAELYAAIDKHGALPAHKARVWNSLPVNTRAEFVARHRAGRSFTAPWLFAGGVLPEWFPPDDPTRPILPPRFARRWERVGRGGDNREVDE
jgi:hypothetical protein